MGKKKYESIYGDQKKLSQPCERCGKTVKRRVDPADVSRYKFYCHNCRFYLKQYPQYTHDKSDAEVRKLAEYIMLHHGASEVKVFKPGDKGFKQRAQEFFDNRKENHRGQYYWRTFGRN